MKIDLYTKSMLTIIAVGIVALVIQNFTTSAEAQFGNRGIQKVALCARVVDKCVEYYDADKSFLTLSVVDTRVLSQLEFLNKQIAMLVGRSRF